LPEAVLNFLTLMGWSHPEQKEIFTINEFFTLFRLEDIKPVGPVFDLTKLTWMNQQYIIALSEEELLKKLKVYISVYGSKKIRDSIAALNNDELLKQLLPLLRERMQTLKDFETLAGHFLIEPTIVASETEKPIVKDLYEEFSKVAEWEKGTILAVSKTVLIKYSIRMPVLYTLLTGYEKGLPLPESLVILGKEKTMKRLESLL
jgi:glutamyl/glutaminyl-tRNA synthetase